MKAAKIYKMFQSRRMAEPMMILCDTQYQLPMTYSGIKAAEKAAEKHNGSPMRAPLRMNLYYIVKN